MKLAPLTLAPRAGHNSPAVIPAATAHLVIVGANGAGKTRFATYLADNTPGAVRISALHALYDQSYTNMAEGSVDSRYFAESQAGHIVQSASTQAERLTALMLREEMTRLLAEKLSGTQSDEPSPLDTLISLWQEIFPDNKILVEAGQLLIRSHTHSETYSSVRLSAGERAVLYHIGSVLMAPEGATLFIDSPEMFLHPTITRSVWNRIELLRPDCRFIYVTHDLDFTSSRLGAPVVWVRNYDFARKVWDYEVLPADSGISESMYATILGARKPVLFIEGDGIHSIDSKLYPLIFRDYTVKPLGSCNKVIEATRTFNDLSSYHHMDSYGIVDRDRRDKGEVEYLRSKKIMVPDAAEVENILLLEHVVKAVASYMHKNPERVFEKVKRSILNQFAHDLRQQALLHTRHRVKRLVECRIDGRFPNIAMLEKHMRSLPDEIKPRELYESYCRDFHICLQQSDYAGVLRVYNQKSMLPACNVAGLCGLHDKEHYIRTIIEILKSDAPEALMIRNAVARCLGIRVNNSTDKSVQTNAFRSKGMD